MPELSEKKVPSAWAVALWERLQDVMANEEAWEILDAAKVAAGVEATAALGLAHASLARSLVAIEGADERSKLLLKAKNHWADKTVEGLGHIEALEMLLGPEDLTEETAVVVAEATEFLRGFGRGPCP